MAITPPITGNYTLAAQPNLWKNLPDDEVRLICDTTGGPVQITLPSIASLLGFWNVKLIIVDKNNNAGVNPITIIPAVGSGNTIDGAASAIVNVSGGSAVVQVADTGKWYSTENTSVVPGGGTVTNVAVANLAGLFTSSVATPSSTPSVSYSLSTQTANMVFAGPTSGLPASPTFRSLVNDDLPVVNELHGGTNISSYAIGDTLYASAPNTLSKLAIGANGDILTVVAGIVAWAPPAPSGITSLNLQTGTTQTFATGTAGTDFSISSALDVHTFNIPSSSALNRGLLLAADWTTFNNKFDLPALTSGSVLFSNGTTIAQDNANFFYDDTNNRLGLGTTTPAQALDIVGAIQASDSYWLSANKFIHQTNSNTNTYVGRLVGLSSTGANANNTGIGRQALEDVTTGSELTAIGCLALSSQTAGGNNVAVGYSALGASTTSVSNVAVGLQSLNGITTSGQNTAIGEQSGNLLTSGGGCTFVGYLANVTVGTESDSTAIGKGAMITASNQLIIGSSGAPISNAYIGTSVAQPDANLFVGAIGVNQTSPTAKLQVKGAGATSATYTIKAEDSTANLNFYVRDDGAVNSRLGYWIGDDKVLHYGFTNSTSIFVGRNSGTVESVVGNGNAGVGRNALAAITDGQRCVGVGYNALSSMTVNGNSVGIGWEALRNDTGGENIGIGSSAAPSLTGTRNVVVGQQSGNTMVAAIRNTLIGAYTDVSSATQAYSIALGAHAIITADNQWVVGAAAAVINDAYFGQGVSQPSSITDLSFNATSVAAGQTDTNAGNWYFKGGRGTGTGIGSDFIYQVAPASATGNTQNALVDAFKISNTKSIIVGSAALATNAIDGFLYLSSCAGAPSGVASTYGSTNAIVFNSTDSNLHVYNAGWKEFVSSADGAAAPATNLIGVIVDYYGTSATRVLTTPDSWEVKKINGTTYKAPLYL